MSVPLWDCAGLHCLLDADLTCVLTLHGPPTEMDRGGLRALEQLALRSARHIVANPGALDAVRTEHGELPAGADVLLALPDGGEVPAEPVLGAYLEILKRRKAA